MMANNVGIGTTVPGGDRRMQSADGHELRFAVNYVTSRPRTSSACSRRPPPARLVNVSSAGQTRIDFDYVMLERDYSGVGACRPSDRCHV